MLRIQLLSIILVGVVSGAYGDNRTANYLQAYELYTEAMREGKHALAAEHASLAYRQASEVLADDNDELFQLHFNYGQALLYAHKKTQAKAQLAAVLERAESNFGLKSGQLIDSLLMLGVAKSEFGERIPSEFRRAEKIAAKSFVDAPAQMAGLNSLIGQQFAKIGDPRKAKSYLREALQTYRALEGDDHPMVGRTAFWVGKVELALGNKDAAREYFLLAVEHDSSSALLAHAFLVRVFEELGQPERATEHCQAIGASQPFNPNQQQAPLYITPPEYPRSAQQQGREGEVVVSYTLDEGGFVKDAEVVRTKGTKKFNAAALKAVQKWRFAPRYVEGEAVATAGLMHRITFELN